MYDYHSSAEELDNYDKADKDIPSLFWNKYSNHKDELLKRRDAIMTDPIYIVLYANVLHERIPEGESLIATSAKESYNYAIEVIKGRFPEGEKIILTDPLITYSYVRNIIKDRWLEAEKIFKNDIEFMEDYKYLISII